MDSFYDHLHQWRQKCRFNMYLSNIDINAKDSLGLTPFMYACPNGYKDVVKPLQKAIYSNFDHICVSIWTSVHKRSPSKTLFRIHINVASINVKTRFVCPLVQVFLKWVHPKLSLAIISMLPLNKCKNNIFVSIGASVHQMSSS